MPARKNLLGCVYGRWTVLSYYGSSGQGAMWLCECSCGTKKPVHASSLLHGKSNSCGCLMVELTSKFHKKHGHNSKINGQSPTYRSWRNMLRRCNDPKHGSYSNYGGRGIKVCEEWRNFEQFLADMGERPEDKTLDRIDGDKGYSKENCRWMNMTEQANNRANNHRLTYQGETHTISEWAVKLGIKDGTIRARLFRGFSTEDALQR